MSSNPPAAGGSAWRRLRAVARRLLAPAPPPPHRADFSDAGFFAGLNATSPALVQALEAHRRGDTAAARRAVAEHFRTRTTPRFFVDRGEVAPLLAARRPAWREAVRSRVQADLHEGLRVFETRVGPLGQPLPWRTLPPGPGGDSLYLAQPHRFGFAPRLAIAALEGDAAAWAALAVQLDAWCRVAEAGFDECFHSPLAVLNRVLALSWTMAFVAAAPPGEDADGLLWRLALVLAGDTAWLQPTIGTSYPNNHLLADGFAGWFVGTVYPEFRAAATKFGDATALMDRELERQFLPDGSNFEHAVHYHELGLEMALARHLLERRNGIEPTPAAGARLRRITAFQAALAGRHARVVPIGNAVEEPMFPLDAAHGFAPGAWREVHRALFDARIEAAPAGDVTVERAHWLLAGALAPPPPAAVPDAQALPQHFAAGGVHVFDDPSLDARLVLRSGPEPGHAFTGGHAHDDAMSITLEVAGRPLIVDPGTFSYRFKPERWPAGEPRWRAHFASAAAHSGPVFEADPAGPLTGDFRAREVAWRARGVVHARVEGATWQLHELQVPGAAAHPAAGFRRGVLHRPGGGFFVIDLPAPGGGLREVAVQLAAGLRVEGTGRRHEVQPAGGGAAWCFVAGGALGEAVRREGERSPLAGWVSERYGHRAAAPRLGWPMRGAPAPAVLAIAPARAGLRAVAVALDAGGHVLRLHLEHDGAPPQALSLPLA